MVSDIEVEKDEDTHVENPDSDVVEMENEKLLKLESSGVEEEKSSDLKEVVEKSELPLSNPVLRDAKDLEVGTKDCLVKDGCVDVAAVAGIIVPSVDSNLEDNSNDIQNVSSQAGEDNKKSTDVQNQIESVTPSDSFSEVKRKDEKEEELTVGEIGMDMNNGASVVQSTVGNGTKEIELKNEEVRNDDTLHDGVKMDTSTDTVSGLDMLPESEMKKEELTDRGTGMNLLVNNELKGEVTPKNSFLEPDAAFGEETVTVEEQAEFMKELETFHKERCLEFKPPRFYGEPLNCLKLWRAVVKLGGYEQVTSCKLWRQVGESFKPPKTCTTVSWTFRVFYEKALLEYEKHKMRCGELPYTDASFLESSGAGNQASLNQAVGSGRARRDAAARAMQGWHSRLLGNGEVGDPIVKDKNSSSVPKREKQLKSIGLLKRKAPSPPDHAVKVARVITSKPQLDTMVVDVGSPADWVKINVQKTKDCYEIYALVPGLLREEVRVQTDPAGRLVISGEPEQLDNPWGVSPFKKIVSLPTRIDPQQTSALVTLHGQLFVRVPFEQSEM